MSARRITPDTYLNSRPLCESTEWDQFVKVAASRNQPELLQGLQDYLRDGVVVFESAIATDEVDAYAHDLDFIFTNHGQLAEIPLDGKVHHHGKHVSDFSPDELAEAGVKFCDLHQFSSAGLRLALNSTVVDFLNLLFDAPPALLQSLTFHKGSEQAVHQDFSYVHQQRDVPKLAACWIPLEDIQPESGPLEYYLESHRVDRYGFFDWGGGSVCQDRSLPEHTSRGGEYLQYLKDAVEKHKFERKLFCPKKGDVLIWHGALIHGGTPVADESSTRRSLVCHYTSLDSHPDLRTNYQSGGFAFRLPEHASMDEYLTAVTEARGFKRRGLNALQKVARRISGH